MASIQTLQRAMSRRTLKNPVGRPFGSNLRVEMLEDRSVPSTSIPLSGVQWTAIGPSPVTTVVAADTTSAPGELSTGGGVTRVSTHPTLSNTIYAAATGGGVHLTTDGGATWTPQTDNLPLASIGNNILNRTLNMGTVAYSPHAAAAGLVLAGQGNADFGQYSFEGRGLLRSTDSGATWLLQKGPGNGFDNAFITKIVYHPTNSNIVFMLTRAGTNTLWRSSDRGLNWVDVTLTLPNAASVGGVPLSRNNAFSDFSLDPQNPEIGYLAVGAPGGYVLNGVYRVGGPGSDGVSTGVPANMQWVPTLGGTSGQLPGTTNPIGSIRVTPGVINPSGSQTSTVYALIANPGTQGGGGLLAVFRSQDAGINWSPYVLTNGSTFNFQPSGYAMDLLVDPRNSNIIYVSGQAGVVRLTFNGTSTPTIFNLTTDAAGEGPFRTVHDLEFDANFGIVAATDGGVYRLNSANTDWVSLNGTPGPRGLAVTRVLATALNTTQVPNRSSDPDLEDTLLASTYLNGTINFTDPGGPAIPNDPVYGWTSRDVAQLTNGNLVEDLVNNRSTLRSIQGGPNVRQTLDNGATWANANAGIVNPGLIWNDPAAPLENDPSRSTVITGTRYYYGTNVLNRTTNDPSVAIATWGQFGPDLPFVTNPQTGEFVISALGIGRQNGNLIYAAVSQRLMTDGVTRVGPGLYLYDPTRGGTWRDVSPGRATAVSIMPPETGAPGEPQLNLLTGRIVDITIDPTDSLIVYVVSDTTGPGGVGTRRIWRTVTGGLGANAWTDISGNLPAGGTQTLRPYSITLDENRLSAAANDDVLYVGTTMGVWSLTGPQTSTTWTQLTTLPGGTQQLPDVMVRDLKVNTTSGVLSAATLGRGVWQFQIRPYISGFVFEDSNGNGLRDIGEGPRQGVGVIAIDNLQSGGTAVANTDSRADGFYVFRGLPNSTYTISIGDTTTYQLTSPDQTFAVTQTSTVNNADLGVFIRTTIAGRKFNDLNGDGILDTGEPGIVNWQIELRRADTNAVVAGPVSTLLDGSYAFGNLGVIQGTPFSPTTGYPVIAYRVREINQPNFIQTNANPADIQLASQTPVLNVNFGNFRTFTLSGTKFEDVNGNGIQDGVDAGLSGWVITLTNLTTTATTTMTTIAGGAYSFPNLGPGLYQVRETAQPTWGQVTANPANVPGRSGTDVTGVNFGNFREGTISGTVYEDLNGNGLREGTENGVVTLATVSLINGFDGTTISTTTTDGVGNYSFAARLPIERPGNTIPYLLRVTQASLSQTIPDVQEILFSGEVAAGRDLLVFRRTSLSGQAFEDINGNGIRDGSDPNLANFSIALLDANTNTVVASANTDAFGAFTFNNLPPGTGAAVPPYRVAITVPGWIQTAGSGPVSLVSGVPGTGLFIGAFKTAAFTGVKFNDLNGNGGRDAGEPGLAGWTISLFSTGNPNAISTTTTDASGFYTLNAGPGNFFVRETNQPGWFQVSANPAAVSTASQQVVANQNFGNFRAVNLTGTTFDDANGNGFRDSGEGVVTGFTNQLLDSSGVNELARTISDAAGNYAFNGIGPGTYQIKEVLPSGSATSTPNPVVVTTRSGTNVSTSFGNFRVATINGTVFEDLDGSGVQDNGEPGVAGFTVRLVNTSNVTVRTTTTNAAGLYAFGNVPGGSYSVRLTNLPGYSQLTANPAAITPQSGTTVFGGNFGVIRQGSLSGTVYVDGNRNFRKDSFETGAAGAVIGLFDAAGVNVDQQTIGADGTFNFVGLAAGDYAVRLLSIPSNFSATIPLSGDYVRNVASGSTNPANSSGGLDFPLNARGRYAISADGGGGPRVQVYDSQSGAKLSDSFVYEESFTGGVRSATADVNADGVEDLITVAGPGGGPRVRVLDGLTGRELYNFFVYEESFRDGMFVAAGDVDGDGYADIVTGTAEGGGPRVAVFSGRTGERIADFFAYDENFRGGVRVGVTDTNGDGKAEVITGSGPGGGPNVRVWSIPSVQLLSSFFAFDQSFTGGIHIAGSLPQPDLNGRGTILVGSGIGFDNPSIREFDSTGRRLTDTVAFSPTNLPAGTEVRVASVDRNGDDYPDIAIAAGPGSPPRLRFLDGRLFNRQVGSEELAYEATFLGGVYIG